MDSKYSWDSISREDFNGLLAKYTQVIPEKLKALDQKRLHDIPRALAARRNGKGKEAPGLEKDELLALVEWKLSHGTFRPRLLSLASSNSNIPEVTSHAFSLIPTAPILSTPILAPAILAALKHLTTLSGIGPATASLILSTLYPDDFPFFSDEMFRWMMWDEPAKDGKKGWERKIGYTAKEYEALFGKVGEVRERLGCGARQAECVAYVLGKTGGRGLVRDEVEEVDGVEVEGGGVAKGKSEEREKAKPVAKGKPAPKKTTEKKEKKEKKESLIDDDDGSGNRRRSKRLKTTK
ncbi:hypothetical protein B9Z65_8842 [Elsinoe australis]|uniref:Uncharacterized protein n=1 Tax=Elsinoe australis TaxID=40998 RepID=A0A2P7YEY7_9PEZI|nr:hypothetical protein B9Z65_8842 [Elsinoe australis]